MKNALFVTATDTGAGKTMVTGLLGRYIAEKGRTVITQKWVQTGCAGRVPADIKTHLAIMGRTAADIRAYRNHSAPYIFKTACSPHLAAALEKRRININRIKKSFAALVSCFDYVIVEGAGGVLVPFDGKSCLIDIAQELHIPALLVVNNKLGAINHGLLSIEALKARRIKILGLIFNQCVHEKPFIAANNPKIINGFSKIPVLGILPHEKDYDKLYDYFAPIGEKTAELLSF